MLTLEKQQKKGYYSIHIAYERVIEQHILKNLAQFNEIPTFTPKILAGDEFRPGRTLLTYLSSLTAVRMLKGTYERSWKADPAPKSDTYTTPKTGTHAEKVMYILSWIARVAPFTTRDISDLVNKLMYVAIFSIEYRNNGLRIGKTICSNIVFPTFLASIIDATLVQQVEMKWSKQKTFDTIIQKASGYFLNWVKEYWTKFLVKDGINFNEGWWKKVLSDLLFIFQTQYMSIGGSIILYPIATMGAVALYRVFCRKVMNNVMTLEIEKQRFNKLLQNIVYFLNEKKKQKNMILFDSEYDILNDAGMKVSVLQFNIHNKVYENENDVANQMPFIIKELLKSLPQNVYVKKVEYFGYEEDNALGRIKSRNYTEESNNDGEGASNAGAFDIIQTLYSSPSRKRTKNENEKEERESNLTSVDKLIIKYVKQHRKIYDFNNRKTLSRQFLLDVITNRFKPSVLSPTIPHVYKMTFVNQTEDPLKYYFYNNSRPWFKHVRTIKDAREKEVRGKKTVYKDVYIVELAVKKFVEMNLQNIINDIPNGLEITDVSREVEGDAIECTMFRVYPILRSKNCQLPNTLLTEMDKKIIDALQWCKIRYGTPIHRRNSKGL